MSSLDFKIPKTKTKKEPGKVPSLEAQPGDKIILVSQFTSFLSILQPLLCENLFPPLRLDGSMSHMVRSEVVSAFQSRHPHSPQVLLLSLKAGGVGLNLTAAKHLLLLDPDWNPACEWQCFDRTHRMGQTKDVTIYKFITKDSIEEEGEPGMKLLGNFLILLQVKSWVQVCPA